MANPSMDPIECLHNVPADEGIEPLREAVRAVSQEVMEAEVSEVVLPSPRALVFGHNDSSHRDIVTLRQQVFSVGS